MLDSEVLNTDYDLAEMSDLQRPNLLDNADFKSGIINERGGTTYTGKTGSITYTIDRWWVSKSTSAMLSVNNGYISISLPTLQSVGQFIEFEPNGEMTIAVKLRNNDLKVFTLDNYKNNIDALVYNFGEIDTDVSLRLLKYSSDDKWQVVIYNESGSTKEIDIEYIKLEKGSIYTGMPIWIEANELTKCKRYYQNFYRYAIFVKQVNNVDVLLPLVFSPTMVKTPTLYFSEILNENAQPSNRSVVTSTVTKTNIINIKLDQYLGTISGYVTFAADAETY